MGKILCHTTSTSLNMTHETSWCKNHPLFYNHVSVYVIMPSPGLWSIGCHKKKVPTQFWDPLASRRAEGWKIERLPNKNQRSYSQLIYFQIVSIICGNVSTRPTFLRTKKSHDLEIDEVFRGHCLEPESARMHMQKPDVVGGPLDVKEEISRPFFVSASSCWKVCWCQEGQS